MDFPESVTPQQRLMNAHGAGVRRWDLMRLPLFGLPAGWSGTRCTGAQETRTGVTRDDSGVHGEWHETGELVHGSGTSLLSVTSSDLPAPIDDAALLALLDAPGECRPTEITLAGDRVSFAAAFAAEDWVARWVGYRATVTVRGHRWPVRSGLELVRVDDLAPYHEGRLLQLEQRSGFDLRE